MTAVDPLSVPLPVSVHVYVFANVSRRRRRRRTRTRTRIRTRIRKLSYVSVRHPYLSPPLFLLSLSLNNLFSNGIKRIVFKI